ncbi:MAG TPA: carbohydrate-binding protein, partial [Ktedonobacteraceae bacterium]|nr:carbohydrate-binding protein [Ktedonobacteraceae bacterium]
GSYTVTIYYLNGESGNRTASLSANGGSSTSLTFSPTGGWNNVGSLTTTVTLNAGSNNTLAFSNSGGWAPDIDRIVVNSGSTGTPTPTPTPTMTPTPTPHPTTSYEAEASNNTLAGGAVVSSCSSCSGGEKVGYIGNGGTLTFNGVSASSAGSYTVTIYYLNGESGNRTASLSVNGGSSTTLTFSPTGGWNNVGSLTTTVTLNAGSNNTLVFSNSGGWAPDIDRIVIA